MSVLQSLNAAMRAAANPEGRVDELYRLMSQPGYDWGQPSPNDFSLFLDTFADWVAAEHKKDASSAAARAAAIRYIKDSASIRPTFVFTGIDATVFGIQLAMRVRRPRSIDQDGSNLCGAVSALYTFAKQNPQGFTQFALDLFFRGQALFGQMEIQPSAQITQGYALRKSTIPWAVDYVILVSLRQCTFLTDKLHMGALRGADETTLPGQLGMWLKQAGYKGVEDHTFFGKNQQKAVRLFANQIKQPMHLENATGDAGARAGRRLYSETNLTEASRSLKQGKVIIVFADGEMGRALRDGVSQGMAARTKPTAIGDHHWMPVRKLDVIGTTVKIKVITWGKSYQGLFDLDAFLSRYNGYVSAMP